MINIMWITLGVLLLLIILALTGLCLSILYTEISEKLALKQEIKKEEKKYMSRCDHSVSNKEDLELNWDSNCFFFKGFCQNCSAYVKIRENLEYASRYIYIDYIKQLNGELFDLRSQIDNLNRKGKK